MTKPSWVTHAGEKIQRCPIYTLSVHRDGTRLATGGLGKLELTEGELRRSDQKIKIWSTLPILDEDAAENDANHKLLCTMSAHNGQRCLTKHHYQRSRPGPVLCVRWAHHGRFLASGSDDQVVMIWGLDPCVLWRSSDHNG